MSINEFDQRFSGEFSVQGVSGTSYGRYNSLREVVEYGTVACFENFVVHFLTDDTRAEIVAQYIRQALHHEMVDGCVGVKHYLD